MKHLHRAAFGARGAAALALLIALMSLTALAAMAADGSRSDDGVWSATTDARGAASLPAADDAASRPSSYHVFALDVDRLQRALAAAPLESQSAAAKSVAILNLPLPDGTFARYRIVESPFLGPDVQKLLPDYRSYLAQGLDDPTANGRFDIGPSGFHAMIRSQEGTLMIDPWSRERADLVLSAWERDFPAEQGAFECESKRLTNSIRQEAAAKALAPSGAHLRVLRLSVTGTDEYFCHFDPTGCTGATAKSATPGLNAIAVTVNRVNAVFENEAAVRFSLVSTISWWGSGSADPFWDGQDTYALMEANTGITNAAIGAANYDIGHVFTTAPEGWANGVAYLDVICNNSYKAGGASAEFTPSGDLFDVRLVCHELGHQFNSEHTWTNGSGCSGTNDWVPGWQVEPGSGSTIMGYAGICAMNVQATADHYFHVKSLEAIHAARDAAACAVVSATGNTPPTVDAGPDATIPRGTPFYLNGSGADADGDVLTYNWEQLDSTQSLFRSVSPTTYGHWRYMPDFGQIFDGSSDPWEVLPTTDRTMHFRLTVRDNRAGGGGVDDDETVVTVAGDPFFVTAPNGGEAFVSGQPFTATWNVGGGSVAANVTVWLFTGSGFEWLGTVPNDGRHDFVMPCGVVSANCRLWIEASTGSSLGAHFMDVSNADFALNAGLPDHAPFHAPGWGDNIVVNSVNSVDLPTSLVGDTTSYMYWAYLNYGAAWGCGTFEYHAMIDDKLIYGDAYASGPAPGGGYGVGPAEPVVPGGRHAIWLVTDPNGLQAESDESNNGYARQWIWAPPVAAPGTQQSRAAPPIMYAGLDWLPAGVEILPNLDGLRLAPASEASWWRAAAISSTDASHDNDIYLFAPSTGVENGFDAAYLAVSAAGGAYTDAVISNRNAVENVVYDVGLLNYSGGLAGVGFEFRESDAVLTIGNEFARSVAAGQMVRMEEMLLQVTELGTVTLELKNVTAGQEVTVAVFAPSFSVGGLYDSAYSAVTGPDGRALVQFEATAPGYYGIAVFRHAFEGVDPFTYGLKLWQGSGYVSAVESPETTSLPAFTRIEGVYPNPFNPQTKILLAMHKAGPASVRIYDVQGRLIRTLVDGDLAAGRHELPWNGVDDTGRSAPSGVYFVRMVHSEGTEQHRMSLIK